MQYTTRRGDDPQQAHVNYQCPCGCTAGLMYERTSGSMHLGACCCGRLLWVGDDAESQVKAGYEAGVTYVLDRSDVSMPWGEVRTAILAVPAGQLADASQPLRAQTVRDVVCGMMIDPAKAAATSEY